MAGQQEQQVIYLVMDENNQGQQIQFIDGQPTIVMDQQSELAAADADSQVLLVSEDGQLVTGNEGQVMVDESGQVVMTTDEGQQVALETEHLNVSQPPVSQIQYVLTSEATGAKGNILTQAASVITEEKVQNGSSKEDDGYTTIMIGGEQAMPSISTDYASSQPTTSITHPILSTQLGVSGISTKSPQKVGSESPRAMISILNKARLASLTQQQTSPMKPSKVAESEQTQEETSLVEVEAEEATIIEQNEEAQVTEGTTPMEVLQKEGVQELEDPAKVNGEVMEVDNVAITVQQETTADVPEAELPEEGELDAAEAEAMIKEQSVTAPVEDVPEEEAVMEEAPVKEAPIEDDVVEEAPIEDDVVEEAPIEDAVVEEAPIEDAVVEKAPVEEDAAMLAKSLDEYMIKRPDVTPAAPEETEEENKTLDDSKNIGTGTVLGPLPYDSDDSGPEIPFSDPPHAVATYQGKNKKDEKKKALQRNDADDDSSRRKSGRNKSPRRYSEEPIIFGDDWVKASPESRAEKEEKKGEEKEEEKKMPPRKRGRPPKHRPIQEESNGTELSEAEQKMPPKKRISREVSISEDKVADVISPRKRGRPPKKRFLEKHNSEEAGSAEEKSMSKLAEKKLIGDATAKEDILDNFGFNEEDSEKDDMTKEVDEPIKKTVDTLLVHKPTPEPVVLSVDMPVVKHLTTVDKETKWDSPIRADNIKITTNKAVDSMVKNQPKEQPSPSESKLKYVEMKTTPKTARPLGTTSSGDRKVGIDVKTMKFSVSKRVSGGSESKRLLSKKPSPSPVSRPIKPVKTPSHEEKDIALRETALMKREQKNRALDKELDERTAQLRAKEGKLERLQRQLKEAESALEMRERKLRREEHSGSKRKHIEMEEEDEQGLKEWENRLSSREEKLRQREQDMEQKFKLLATTEKQLTGLSKELAEKYEYLQDGETQAKVGQPRQGLFERLANLSKEATAVVSAPEKRKADEMEEEEREEREEREEEEEHEEPPRKKTRKEIQKIVTKKEKKLSNPEQPAKRGRGRPRKSESEKSDASEKKIPTKKKKVAVVPSKASSVSCGKKNISTKAAAAATLKQKLKQQQQQQQQKKKKVVATKKQAAKTSRKISKTTATKNRRK